MYYSSNIKESQVVRKNTHKLDEDVCNKQKPASIDEMNIIIFIHFTLLHYLKNARYRNMIFVIYLIRI